MNKGENTLKNLVIIVAVLFIVGCQNSDGPKISKGDNPSYEDVVDWNGDSEHFERFEAFKANTEKGKKDKLVIVQYTTEGDPIFLELQYDGAVFKSTLDTSRDTYGSGEIYHNTCTSIEVVERTDRTEYVLEGCEEQMDNPSLVKWK